MLCVKVLVEIPFLQNLVLLNFYTFLNVLNVRDFIMVSISILLTRRLIFSDLVLLRSNCPCFYWIINICLLVNHLFLQMLVGIPGGAVVKSPPARAGDARDAGSVLGLGRSPGGGNGNPLQCSCLENSIDRGAWWAAAHGVAQSQTQQSTCARAHTHAHAHPDICIAPEMFFTDSGH